MSANEFPLGTVLMRGDCWWNAPDGKTYPGVTGRIEFVAATEVLGFDVNNRDSNWLIRVHGIVDTALIPGCSLQGVHLHPDDHDNDEPHNHYYHVP